MPFFNTENIPAFALTAGSKNINSLIEGRLMSLTLTDNRGFEADQLDIELDDSDGKLALPRRGETLTLALGWKNESLIPKGKFIVDEIEYSGAPDRLTLRARSADFRATLNTRREASYHNKTLEEIVTTLACRNQLTPCIDAALKSIQIAHIDQTNESDGAFLTRLGQQEGALATVKNDQLLFLQQGKSQTASGKRIPTVTLSRKDGDNYAFSLADRSAYTGVIASWLDTQQPEKKQTVKIARKKPSASNKNTQGDYFIGEDGNVLVLSHTYANRANAARAAKATWAKIQRGIARFSIQLAKGRADIYPETPIKVRGFKPQIDNAEWIVVKVTHNLNDKGFTTALEMEVKITDLEMKSH